MCNISMKSYLGYPHTVICKWYVEATRKILNTAGALTYGNTSNGKYMCESPSAEYYLSFINIIHVFLCIRYAHI